MIQDTCLNALEKALCGVALRHQVIANNIANIETPGYTPRQVSFERALRAAIQRDNSSPVPRLAPTCVQNVTPRIHRQPNIPNQRTNVTLEDQLARLAEASLHYNAIAKVTSRKLTMLRLAINGGGRQ